MGETIPFGPRRTKRHNPQTLADKLQVLLLLWPEAGAAVERFVDYLLAEFSRLE
jgi:hypothetical protein